MSGSTITGLGSGLDINALVDVMAKAQKAPKEAQLERQVSRADAQLSAVGMLKNALSTFESSLKSLSKSASSFAGLQASSSETKTATATLSEGAVAGTYALEVKSLATASKVATAVQDADAKFASGGMLKIEVGATSYSINVEADASLADIRELINSKWSAAGLTANVISDSSGERLVLSSNKTGDDQDIVITGADDLAALNVNGKVALDAETNTTGAGYIVPAADAVYTLDGLEMTSAENKVTGLSGLSIELKEVGKTTLSVAANTSGLTASVDSFVMAYNTLLTVTNGLTKVTTSENGGTQAGALVADASLRSLMSSLRSALVTPVAGGDGVNMLAQLGISTSKEDGKLVVDSEALKKAAADNPAGIKAFFTGDNGMLKRVGDISNLYSKSGGLLESRETSLKSTLTDLASEKAALNARIDKLTTSLFKKFNAMDSLVARLNTTSQSVMATLNALNNKKDD